MVGVEGELKRKSLIELAVLCGKIAGNSSANREAANKAHALRLEWVRLQEPPQTTLQEQQKPEARQEALKQRMAEFLATTH